MKNKMEFLKEKFKFTKNPLVIDDGQAFEPNYPPAPKLVTANDITDEMLDLVETTTTGAGAWDTVKPKELIAVAYNAVATRLNKEGEKQ